MRRKTSNIRKRAKSKIAKSLLDMIILKLLDEKPMHGYIIIAQIRITYGIWLSVSSVYPLLYTLEANGYIKSSEVKTNIRRCPKKVYSLTVKGKKFLDFTEESLILICQNLMKNGKPNGSTEIAPDKLNLQVKRLKRTR